MPGRPRPGRGEIRICAENISIQNDEAHLSKGRYVKMVFEDHGCGIKKVFLDKIFDPYFSTKNHTIQAVSGLGLPISQSIIDKHGGAIRVKSVVGMGTTLFVYLPAGDAQTVAKEAEIKTETEIPIFGNGRILIMDDEKTIRELGGKIVTRLGYDVEFACTGSEAVDQYKQALDAQRPYDAVILDLTVSGAMDGVETVEKLIKLDPQVRAIVSSGYASQPDITDFEQHGFRGFVARPYTEEELRVALDRLLPAVQ